ncbi:MAG: hypothetical protein LBL24_03100, partial [Bacteroidales bacterium]|nr:hypothetical protein [Bacteroidales bacterium]
MENSQVKLPKAAYFDSRIDCRIANPAMFRAAIQLPLNDAACFAYRGGVMKTLKILIFVVLALSMVTGCMDFVPPRQEAVEVEIEIEPVLTGKGEMTYFEGFTIPDRVITSVEKWNELKAAMRDRVYGLNTFDETDIDFSAYQVIAIFDEMHGNGGWSIDITGIVEYSDRIVISVTHLKTGDPSRVFTQPYHIVRIPASSKEIVFQEEDNGYDGEPKEISFTEYSLAKTSCQWTKLNNNDEAVVINSNEELNRYVTCTDNDYPAIDFSKYTLLVAHGTATSSVVSVNCSRLQQISEQGYTMNVDLVLGNATVMSPWQVVLITDKINAQGVILNLNKHFGTDNTLPACTTRIGDAVHYLTDYQTTILKEYSQDRSLSSHIVIAKLFDDTEPTAYLTVEHFSTYRICNYPQYA